MKNLIIFVFLIKMVLCGNSISGTTSFDATQQYPLFNRLSSTSSLSASQNNISSMLEPKNLNADQTISIKHNNNGIFNRNKDHNRFLSGDSRLDSSRQTASNTDEFEGRVLSNKNSILLKGYLPENINDDHCSTYKYVLDSDGIIQYDHSIPVLDQFTFCSWVKFTNHSGDHSIFTYSVDGEPREIQFWVSNSKGSSYLSLAVHGQTLYRLNYPLKLQQWHHTCTSWNGKTGEWQLWIKAYRVGRGFHNRLNGHIIKPNGMVFSGGKSVNGQGADGLHMEITLLQLYKVALSAGKANRDHKHHHVHLYNHDGLAITNESSQIQPQSLPISSAQSSQSSNSSLVNGQILKTLNINLAGVQPEAEQLISTPDLHVQELPSQLAGDLNAPQGPQPLNASQLKQQPQTQQPKTQQPQQPQPQIQQPQLQPQPQLPQPQPQPQPQQQQQQQNQQQQNQQQQIQEQKLESELLNKPQLLVGSPLQPQQRRQQEELERLQQQQQELQQILIQQEQQMQQQQQQIYQRRPHSLLESSLNYQFRQSEQQQQLLQLQHQHQHQQEQHQQHQQELIQQQLVQLHQQQRQLQQQQRQVQHLQKQLLQQQIAVDTKLINVHYSLTGQYCSHPSQFQPLQSSQIQNLQPARPEQSIFKFPTPTSFENTRNRVNAQYINNDRISGKSHLIFKRNVPQNLFEFDRYAKYGVPAIQEYISKTIDIDDIASHQDREPAECEVKSVLETCSSHNVQPFLDALIMSWQNVRIKTINAFKVCSQNGCGDFPTKNKCSNTFIN